MLQFVLTNHPPGAPPQHDERLTFTFLSGGVAEAVARAKAAAGEKAVQIGGGATGIGQLLRAGRVDELHIDVMPAPLGGGLRSFNFAEAAAIRLENIGAEEEGP